MTASVSFTLKDLFRLAFSEPVTGLAGDAKTKRAINWGVIMQRKRAGLLLLVGLVIVGLVLACVGLAWLASGREIVPSVTTRALGPCNVDWHAKRGALVLAWHACDGRSVYCVSVPVSRTDTTVVESEGIKA